MFSLTDHTTGKKSSVFYSPTSPCATVSRGFPFTPTQRAHGGERVPRFPRDIAQFSFFGVLPACHKRVSPAGPFALSAFPRGLLHACRFLYGRKFYPKMFRLGFRVGLLVLVERANVRPKSRQPFPPEKLAGRAAVAFQKSTQGGWSTALYRAATALPMPLSACACLTTRRLHARTHGVPTCVDSVDMP